MREILALTMAGLLAAALPAAERTLDGKLHHLRNGVEREWDEFPEKPEAGALTVPFKARKNAGAFTLRLRQQDVKQNWKVLLNGKPLGQLPRDENDMVVYFPIAAGLLSDGDNLLAVEQADKKNVDDVRVGEIVLIDQPQEKVLNQAKLEVHVTDGDTKKPVPCRITILDADGALATVGAKSDADKAVRPGVIYTARGAATFGVPAGAYTIHGGRGVEWGVAAAKVKVAPGDTAKVELAIRRQTPTPGYVSCDTHVHTLTFSGHGDASITERMHTLAGEGIELPIATDHNVHIDYEKFAGKLGVRRYFTPVIGNEVTTSVGHFNVFPIRADAPVPDHKPTDWKVIFENIHKTPDVGVVILNHPRDLHRGYRPFGPKHHNRAVGKNLDGWKLRANGVELINSGATLNDPMRVYHDWFGLLNRGVKLTPVGSSDSHDVARHFVGQGRTYIRVDDKDPGKIDVAKAVESFRAGRVIVSYGLLADILVNDKYGPGDLVKKPDELRVDARVLGPDWVKAEVVELYANGKKIREAKIADGARAGAKWAGSWTLPRPKHDMHLVVIARGPGVRELYWPMAKPYQRTSNAWKPTAFGSTGAVWIDGDRDGVWSSPREQALRVIKSSGKNLAKVIAALADYDEAVAAQAADALQEAGVSLSDAQATEMLSKATPAVQAGFRAFLDAWRESQIARTEE